MRSLIMLAGIIGILFCTGKLSSVLNKKRANCELSEFMYAVLQVGLCIAMLYAIDVVLSTCGFGFINDD